MHYMTCAETSTNKFKQYEVKNEPGCGSFWVKIKEGKGRPVRYKIPVYKFTSDIQKEEFFASALQDEGALPIYGFRNGPKGTCEFKINRNQVTVNNVTDYLLPEDDTTYGTFLYEWKEVVERIDNEKYWIEGGGIAPDKKNGFEGEHIHITGTTIAGEPFTAYVYYQPSKIN